MALRRQKGAALVVALVIVAMATILATAMVWENHLDRRRTGNQLFGSEALANALGVEDFVRDVLANDERESDHLLEPWARQGDVFPIEGGSLQGSVVDLQGRFNINNLVNWNTGQPRDQQIEAYRALIQSLGLDERLVDATVDWIDPDIEPRGFNGAEDDTYLRNDPAYRTANMPLANISELRLLANMTPEQFAVLEPYVIALPPVPGSDEPTKININTASPELLSAVGENLEPDDAASIVDLRNQEGFPDLASAQAIVGAEKLSDELFDVKSEYFRLHVLAVIGSSRVSMYSVLHRDPQSGTVRTLGRSLGTP
ncbi:MAG: type II secretion system minor pseudopilin GspK [Proteobacteria bacterium]|nr:type II secretion system minor pseudopilin GspK [Pseudomonadota bacterium]